MAWLPFQKEDDDRQELIEELNRAKDKDDKQEALKEAAGANPIKVFTP